MVQWVLTETTMNNILVPMLQRIVTETKIGKEYLCSQNNLFITNTFYDHRDTQVYTWYKWNDITIKSEIDYILTTVKERYSVTDARVISNSPCANDYKIVVITTRSITHKIRKNITKNEGHIKVVKS
jgi:hypothetical protein